MRRSGCFFFQWSGDSKESTRECVHVDIIPDAKNQERFCVKTDHAFNMLPLLASGTPAIDSDGPFRFQFFMAHPR